MREARGAIPGFEDHACLPRALDARYKLARLLKRPGGGGAGGFDKRDSSSGGRR
jgi:hypothetical protein